MFKYFVKYIFIFYVILKIFILQHIEYSLIWLIIFVISGTIEACMKIAWDNIP